MKLYSAKRAPSPRRILMLMAEKGLQPELIHLDLLAGDNLRDDFTRLNPIAKVPLLQLDDGTCIAEVGAINRYLDEQFPKPCLLGHDAVSKAIIEMWDRRIEQGLMIPVMQCYQHTRGIFRDRMTPIKAWGQAAEQQAKQFVPLLEQAVQQTAYIAGEQFSVADITALCALEFSRVIQLDWTDYPALQQWYQRMQQRPSYGTEF